MSIDLQMFEAVMHLVEGLGPDTALTLQVEKSSVLSGCSETKSIHNTISVNFVLENINSK